jgi:spore germination protein KC
MKRAFQCVLLAALVASFAMLTGCWNYQELESRYVVGGIAVDRGKQGHRYLLTFEVLDLSGAGNGGAGDGAGGQMKGKLIRSEGDTIADAVDEASKISDKELYYSDCKIVVFSKEIAAEGLTPVLDWLNRDPKPRFTVQAFVSQEETAGELFETGGQSGGVISTQISDSMEAVSTGGKSRQMHLNDVDNILLGEGEDLTLPCLRKSGKKNPQVEVNGTAVFRGDQYAGFLNDDQTQNFLLLMNDLKKSVLLVGEKPEEKNIALIVRKSSVTLTPEISGGTIKMKVKMKMQCSFDEENSEKNYLLNLGAKRVEGLANSTLQERLREAVRQVQTEFGCDIFGFGRKIYQEDPKDWEKLKSSWREKFRTVSVEAEADVSIVDTEFTQPKGST